MAGFIKARHIMDNFASSKPFSVNNAGRITAFERDHVIHRPDGRLDWQLLYVASGRSTFWSGSQKATLTAGEAFLYRPGEPQHYIHEHQEQTEVYWVHFSGTGVAALMAHIGLREKSVLTQPGDLRPPLERIMRRMQENTPAGDFCAETQLLSLLADIGRRTLTPRAEGSIHRVRRYIEEHYDMDTDNTALAAMCHLSPSQFVRRFTALTGVSPRQYRNTLRLQNAMVLLKDTEDSVSEIAASVGYTDPLYFSRAFKQHTGLSPLAYRKNM